MNAPPQMQIVLQTIIGPETSARVEATCWTPKEIGRLIQILTIMKDWLEQDERDENPNAVAALRAAL